MGHQNFIPKEKRPRMNEAADKEGSFQMSDTDSTTEIYPPGFDSTRITEAGVHEGIRWATANAPLYGAVNGYALLPEGHKWRDLDLQMEDYEKGPDIHGGVTFGPKEGWIGFDTIHAWDVWDGDPNPYLDAHSIYWTPELVKVETLRLAEQIAKSVES